MVYFSWLWKLARDGFNRLLYKDLVGSSLAGPSLTIAWNSLRGPAMRSLSGVFVHRCFPQRFKGSLAGIIVLFFVGSLAWRLLMYEHSALVYMCVNIYMQVCLNYSIYIYIYISALIYTDTKIYFYIRIFQIDKHPHTHLPIYRSTFILIYIYIYHFKYLYIYTYTYLQTYTYVNSFETFAKEYPFNYIEIHKYADIYIYIYIYVHIFVHT